jgi:hypothetical protein
MNDRTIFLGVAMGALVLSAAHVFASAPPTTISDVLQGCAPVIKAEYEGDKSPWGNCVAVTQAFVDYVAGPPKAVDDTNSVSGDLAYELAKLYEDGDNCRNTETELPIAIQLASKLSTDAQQQKLINQIGLTISSCQKVETGSIGDPPFGEKVSDN